MLLVTVMLPAMAIPIRRVAAVTNWSSALVIPSVPGEFDPPRLINWAAVSGRTVATDVPALTVLLTAILSAISVTLARPGPHRRWWCRAVD